MSRLTIRAASTDEARNFWLQQADARIFLHPDVLEPLCERVDWWLASWKTEPVCLWPVCHAADGSHRAPDLSAYVGPLWHDAIHSKKAHIWWSITRDVHAAFVEFLVDKYTSLEFELPPGTRDTRIFQWLQDDGGSATRIEVRNRHTACIEIQADGYERSLMAGMCRDRAREVRIADDAFVLDDEATDPAKIYALYAGMLGQKMQADLSLRRKKEVLALVDIARTGLGNLLVCRDADMKLAGFSLSLYSRRTASLVLNASSAQARVNAAPTWLHYQSMLAAAQGNLQRIDFMGANSPLGADEKHRCGAWPEMYFRVSVSPR